MISSLHFDPQAYPERVLRLVMKKAQEWSCPPGEALARLLDKLADKEGVPPSKKLTTPPANEGREA